MAANLPLCESHTWPFSWARSCLEQWSCSSISFTLTRLKQRWPPTTTSPSCANTATSSREGGREELPDSRT
jgi:hypothetical protein